MERITYKKLIDELMPLYEQQHNRFMRFYNAVWLMLYNMVEGEKLVIADRCHEADRDLFVKVAALIMISDMPSCRYYYFFDDKMAIIQRGIDYIPPKNNHSKFYDKKRA